MRRWNAWGAIEPVKGAPCALGCGRWHLQQSDCPWEGRKQ